MTNITIPAAALEDARIAFAKAASANPWQDPIEAACLAMLSAWPGMKHDQMAHEAEPKAIILPLPPQAAAMRLDG